MAQQRTERILADEAAQLAAKEALAATLVEHLAASAVSVVAIKADIATAESALADAITAEEDSQIALTAAVDAQILTAADVVAARRAQLETTSDDPEVIAGLATDLADAIVADNSAKDAIKAAYAVTTAGATVAVAQAIKNYNDAVRAFENFDNA